MQIFKNIQPGFVDMRGAITKILDGDIAIRSILLISSKAGSVRANHYHKKDSHYSYLLSGKMEYFEKAVKGEKIESAILEPGDMVFTPPMTVHAMKFLEDSVFLAFATEPRAQERYEEDTVRVPLIDDCANTSQETLTTRNSRCRACKGTQLTKFLSLGFQPPANAFLKEEDLKKPELVFPLDVYFCKDCSLVQLIDVVSPELLFRNYVYVSSTSPVFVSHFVSLADRVINFCSLLPDDLVVDIGSNDGILLRPFKERGMRVLGVDPAVKIAEIATANGIKTIPDFFTPEIAARIVKEKGRASLVTATNIFPHINDLDSLVAGVKELLCDEGVFLIEVYYLADLLSKNLFDTVYHEHLSYFTVRTLQVLFKRLDMEIFHIEHIDTHGGSLRVFVQKKGGSHRSSGTIEEYLNEERKSKLDVFKTYEFFSRRISKNKEKLLQLLDSLKKQRKKIVGYGAPAKGNTLLNYFQIGKEVIDYVVDDSPWKQGLYTPGSHIPVVAPDRLFADKPDFVFILAWNFAEPIMKKLETLRDEGVRFIIPVPGPHIV